MLVKNIPNFIFLNVISDSLYLYKIHQAFTQHHTHLSDWTFSSPGYSITIRTVWSGDQLDILTTWCKVVTVLWTPRCLIWTLPHMVIYCHKCLNHQCVLNVPISQDAFRCAGGGGGGGWGRRVMKHKTWIKTRLKKKEGKRNKQKVFTN